jgi:epoxyqueuosine reductase
MTPDCLTAALKQEAVRLGFDLVGATPAATPPELDRFYDWLKRGYAGRLRYLAERAEAYRHPRHVLDGVRGILMLGVGYRTVEPAELLPGQGRISRYAWGSDYHEVVRRRLQQLADFHRRLVPAASVRGVVDTAPLLERQFGRLAGLGWIGKNTMLINERLGSWFFLAALLSSEELRYDQPCDVEGCGSCRACIDACPTGALVEPYRLDARRCVSYLSIELREAIPIEFREAIGPRLFGCDTCQEVCPWNRRTATTAEAEFQPLPGTNPVHLAELLSLDEAAFSRRFRHTLLWRAKRRGILRNAAIVLGNQPHDAAAAALLQGLKDGEPLVRGGCAWALGHSQDQHARQALRNRLAVEPDPDVRAGISAALGSYGS